jgi:antitoxin ParD1/3/4
MANTARKMMRKLRQQHTKRLRQIWDTGVVTGSAGELDMRKLRRQARERLKRAVKAVG